MATSRDSSSSSAVIVTDLTDSSESSTRGVTVTISTICPVCSENYTEPKLLPCAHRFCRKCLITWFDSANGAPSCPICKRNMGKDGKRKKKVTAFARENTSAGSERQVQVHGSQKSATATKKAGSGETKSHEKKQSESEELVDKLPTDTVLATLVASAKRLQPPHVCSVCPQRTSHAEDMCLHCDDMLCQTCSLFHSRMSTTRDHQVGRCPLVMLLAVLFFRGGAFK